LFKTLKDEKMFKTVKVAFDTIEWANGVDLDPEVLYEKSKTKNKTPFKPHIDEVVLCSGA
jgi:hypothetical protein